MVEKKKIALALQGGGAHGAFTWGVLDQLLEDGRFHIEGVSGTSAGGMNAVALVQGLLKGGLETARQELQRFWEHMSHKSGPVSFKTSSFDKWIDNYNLNHSPAYYFMNFLQGFLSPYQFNPLNMNPLEEIVENFFDFDLLHKAKDPKVFLCATHVRSGKLKIFKLEDLSKEVLLASACLPFLFQAVNVGGEYYWDGGFVGNPAIYPLIYECETPDIVVIQLTKMYRDKLPVTGPEIIDRHKEITYNACLMREMRSINFVSKLIDKGLLDSQKVKRLHMHLIRDEHAFANLELSSALNPDWKFLQYLFQSGRRAASKWIEETFEFIGVRTTADIEKDFV